jgi:Flp pilus assembly protein TadD
MPDQNHGVRASRRLRGLGCALAVALVASACAQSSGLGLTTASSELQSTSATEPGAGRSDLEKATDYWGKEYAKNPRDLKAALSYARNLKAAGQKSQAFAVVQQTAVFNGEDRELASEYGRLALDLGQVQVAEKVLAGAEDPAKPDWRLLSARGTALAKQGKFAEAVPFYERALTLAPDQPSVLNNLAMAHVAQGEAAKAEPMLQRAAETKGADPKIQRNLALVLALQGKYDDAKAAGTRGMGAEVASADTEAIRKMVRIEPATTMQASASPAITTGSIGSWATVVAPRR